MRFEPDFELAPETFRELFAGQALKHLDEMVTSWRMGGHPIVWAETMAAFQVHLSEGPAALFRLHAPKEGLPARVEVDASGSAGEGVPAGLVQRLWEELADIGSVVENPYAPLTVPLGRFSRGDRKVFLAYALTIARSISCPPQL